MSLSRVAEDFPSRSKSSGQVVVRLLQRLAYLLLPLTRLRHRPLVRLRPCCTPHILFRTQIHLCSEDLSRMADSTSTPVDVDVPLLQAPHPSLAGFEVPKRFKLHTENSASILLPDTADAFLNPVQEFNRDLSIACIRVWSDDLNEKKRLKWMNKNQGRKEGKGKGKRLAEEDVAPQGEPSSKKLKGRSIQLEHMRLMGGLRLTPSRKTQRPSRLFPWIWSRR